METTDTVIFGMILTLAISIAKSAEKVVTWAVRKKWPKADEKTAPTVICHLSPEVEHILKSTYETVHDVKETAERSDNIIAAFDYDGKRLVHGHHVKDAVSDKIDALATAVLNKLDALKVK